MSFSTTTSHKEIRDKSITHCANFKRILHLCHPPIFGAHTNYHNSADGAPYQYYSEFFELTTITYYTRLEILALSVSCL